MSDRPTKVCPQCGVNFAKPKNWSRSAWAAVSCCSQTCRAVAFTGKRWGKPFRDRVLGHISPEPNTGCWLWTEGDNGRGYGRLHFAGRSQQAHRVFYSLIKGPIPDGHELDHQCRVTCCVNPDHLDPVPHRINVRRGRTGAVSADRQRSKTHCPRGHAYEGNNLIVRASGARGCRECRRMRDRERAKDPKRKAAKRAAEQRRGSR